MKITKSRYEDGWAVGVVVNKGFDDPIALIISLGPIFIIFEQGEGFPGGWDNMI